MINNVYQIMFDKMIQKQQKEVMNHLNKMLEPLLKEAEKYFQEFLDAEEKLKRERFSRN